MEISNRDKIINMRIMIMCAWKETFFSMPMPPKDAPLKLLLAGFTHKDASYRIVRNGLDDIYVLEYVISGKGHLHWGISTIRRRRGTSICFSLMSAMNIIPIPPIPGRRSGST